MSAYREITNRLSNIHIHDIAPSCKICASQNVMNDYNYGEPKKCAMCGDIYCISHMVDHNDQLYCPSCTCPHE